ncbi:hypothetical protein J1N35_005799, partial [Gossypium stocksii]
MSSSTKLDKDEEAFFSNVKLEHNESSDTIIVITSFLTNTPIRLTLEEFGNLLHLPLGGNFDEKCHYNPTLYIESRLTSKLNTHDRVLHLIITWNWHPTKKHVKLCNTNYWWLDSIHSNRYPDLALIMFNDITKAIGR